MTWAAAVVVGLIVGPMMSGWFGVLSFALGVGIFAGARTALRGPEWEESLKRGTPRERRAAEDFIEGERQRYGESPRFSRGQLFAFEFIGAAGLFLIAAAISRAIFV